MASQGEEGPQWDQPKNVFTTVKSKVRTKHLAWLAVGTSLALLTVVVILTAQISRWSLNNHLSNRPDEETEQAERRNHGNEDYDDSHRDGSWRFGAVAADHPVCSQIGTDILAGRGGSAVDAAIASLICLGALNPFASGIGGGVIMTIYNKTKSGGKFDALNARETAPLLADRDMYVNNSQAALYGGLAIAVPGEVKGLYEAWTRYGRLPWKELFDPTIYLCENGFNVSNLLADKIHNILDLDNLHNLRDFLLKPDGEPYQVGDVMRRPVFAQTLRKIALGNADSFYAGNLADDIVQDIRDAGGIITKQDLSFYRAPWKRPLTAHLARENVTMASPPPPSSGVILQLIIRILEGYNLTSDDVSTTEKTVLTLHRVTEAFKFAFAKRSLLGDEDFVNITKLLADLRSKETAENIMKKINDSKTHPVSFYEPAFSVTQDEGTTHLSVLAPDGSAVAATSTINTAFGSRVVGSRTGIIFNNEMDDFSTPGLTNVYGVSPSVPNYIKPNKRPLSSMSPTIIIDSHGNVRMVVGASGGTRIITSIALTVMKTLWLGSDVGSSVRDPRIHHQLLPDTLSMEPGFSQGIVDGLRETGHEINIGPTLSAVQAIHVTCDVNQNVPYRTERCIHAASDWRKDGEPDGF